MGCMAWGDAEFEFGWPFLGSSLTWYWGRTMVFIWGIPDVWITAILVLVAVPYCHGVPRGMCEYWLRLMEILSLQKGLESYGHHWQADAVLAGITQSGKLT